MGDMCVQLSACRYETRVERTFQRRQLDGDDHLDDVGDELLHEVVNVVAHLCVVLEDLHLHLGVGIYNADVVNSVKPKKIKNKRFSS